MFFRAVTTPLMTPVPNFNEWCAVSNFLFKNIDFCIFTPKTPLVKENYFLTLWNFTYLKDTSFGKKSCNFEHGLETKNEFEKWALIIFFQCIQQKDIHKKHLTSKNNIHLYLNHRIIYTRYFGQSVCFPGDREPAVAETDVQTASPLPRQSVLFIYILTYLQCYNTERYSVHVN